MKFLALASLSVLSATSAFAQAPSTASTLIRNRATGEEIVLSCRGFDLKACTEFDLYTGKKVAGTGKIELTKVNTLTPAALNSAYEESKRAQKYERAAVVPELDTPFEQMFTDVPGYFFNVTQGMWGMVDDYADGSPSSIALAVGAGIASPVTAAVDVAGTVVIDSALIVSYPVRALVKGTLGSGARTVRSLRILKRLKNGKERTVSDKQYNAILNSLSR